MPESFEVPVFNLTNVVAQLQRKAPEIWTGETALKADREYRRFLTLAKFRPELRAVPSRLVDELWHRHILNTEQYARDCHEYFGFFLHHNPSEAPSEDRTLWKRTLAAYRTLFGEEPGSAWNGDSAICDAGGCDTCKEAIATATPNALLA